MSQTNQTSPKVGQLEKKTQERIVKLFQEKLGYTYLGNWEDRENNSNIEEELLKEYLQSTKKYSQTIIDKVVYELQKTLIRKYMEESVMEYPSVRNWDNIPKQLSLLIGEIRKIIILL